MEPEKVAPSIAQTPVVTAWTGKLKTVACPGGSDTAWPCVGEERPGPETRSCSPVSSAAVQLSLRTVTEAVSERPSSTSVADAETAITESGGGAGRVKGAVKIC